MKLELKHLAPYLPYGLKCQLIGEWKYNMDDADYHVPRIFELCGANTEICKTTYYHAFDDEYYHQVESSEMFPILRPFSDLTEDQMILLSKLVGDIHNDNKDKEFRCSNNGRMLVKTPWDQQIEFFWRGDDKIFTV